MNIRDNMQQLTGFHGSAKERGERLLHNNRMEISIGDRHWLGDGSYFYEEDFYAYKWCVDMFKERHNSKVTEEELQKHYLIIKGIISVRKDRIFDMDAVEHRALFDRTYDLIKEKREYSRKFKDGLLAEGVVLNYLFNVLNYKVDYDIVHATFMINRKNYRNIPTRLGYICQVQLCVKNLGIIKRLEKYDYNSRLGHFYKIKETLFIEDIGEGLYNPDKGSIKFRVKYKQ